MSSLDTTLTSRPMAVVYSTGVPSPVRDVGYTIVGTPGVTTYYYWIVANYTWGSIQPLAPLIVRNAPNVLSATNYVSISWIPPSPQIFSYTVLRTTTPVFPGFNSNTGVEVNELNAFVFDEGAPLQAVTLTPMPIMRAVVYLDGTGPVPILVSTVGQQVTGDISVSGNINLTSGSSFPGGVASGGSITTPDGGTLPSWHIYTVELIPPNWAVTTPDDPSPVLIPLAAATQQNLNIAPLPTRTFVQAIRIVVIEGPNLHIVRLDGIGNLQDPVTNPAGNSSFWAAPGFNLSVTPGPQGFSDPFLNSTGNSTIEGTTLVFQLTSPNVNINALVPPLKFSVAILWSTTPLE